MTKLKSLGRLDAEERAPDRFSDKMHGWGIWICIALVLGMAYWVNSISSTVGGVADQQSNTAAQLGREATALTNQRLSLIQGCDRLNQLRASDNTAHFGNYILFKIVLIESKGRESKTPAALRFLARLRRAEASQTWTPMTNCPKVVDQAGSAYRLPQPISFEVKLPPPAALVVPALKHHR